MSAILYEPEGDALGVDDYGYPKVDIFKGAIRIQLGWFFIELDPDEPASYIDQWIEDKGKRFGKQRFGQRFVINVCMGFNFDFVTKLRDYGSWIDHGFGRFFEFADHHIRRRDRLSYLIRNFPFRTKQRLYWFGVHHIPFFRNLSNWRNDRKMRKLLR